MAILINIEPAHTCYEPMQEGMKDAKAGKDIADNPHSEYTRADSRKHDLWLVGFLAAKNKWIVEW